MVYMIFQYGWKSVLIQWIIIGFEAMIVEKLFENNMHKTHCLPKEVLSSKRNKVDVENFFQVMASKPINIPWIRTGSQPY